MMVLGIDPGLAACGFALIEWPKSGATQSPRLLVSGTVKTDTGKSVRDRAGQIEAHICLALQPFGTPHRCAVEYPGAAFGGKAFRGVLENFYVAGFLSAAFSAGYNPNPSTWARGAGRAGERMATSAAQAVAILAPTKRTSEHEREAMAISLWCATQGAS